MLAALAAGSGAQSRGRRERMMNRLAVKLKRRAGAAVRFAASRGRARCAVLLYHRVAEGDDTDPFGLCVAPGRFDGQLAALRRLGPILSVAEVLDRRRGRRLPDRSLAVTFDDGFTDFETAALPLLERHEIPATLFVVSGSLGRPMWWDRLLASLRGAADLPDRISLAGGSREAVISLRGATPLEAFQKTYDVLVGDPPALRTERLEAVEAMLGSPDAAAIPRLLSPEELARIAAHPLVTIGAHTVTHSRLACLEPRAQENEIRESIERLSDIIGHRVMTFSYPFGTWPRDYTADTIAAARQAGLDHAFAADLGMAHARSAAFSLPRFWVHDIDGERLSRRLRLWL